MQGKFFFFYPKVKKKEKGKKYLHVRVVSFPHFMIEVFVVLKGKNIYPVTSQLSVYLFSLQTELFWFCGSHFKSYILFSHFILTIPILK